jgi:predicted ATP-dependent endonuclease of OLD family
MKITKIKIFNYKQFKKLSIDFNDDINLLIGDNDSGKSTILEAINLCLTGYYRNQNLRNNLTSEIFNKEVATKFKDNVLSKGGTEPPMELYKRFRGKEPKPDALLKRAGLL